jgi:hypothetical protein
MKYGIDPKVWNRINRYQIINEMDPTLPLIMFSAALDPLLIHEIDEIPEPRSLIDCVRLADSGTRGDLRDYLRGVLTEWIMEQENGENAIYLITNWDKRLGVWLAAAVAETALRFVPASEERPARAVQAARDWVYGSANYLDVSAAASNASNAAYYAEAADAAYAANAAANAANAAYYAEVAAAEAAAAECAHDAVERAADADPYVGMRNTLVNAVWTYPLEQS